MELPQKSNSSAIEDLLIHRLAIEMAGTLSVMDFRDEVSRQLTYIVDCTRCTFYQLTPDGDHFWFQLFDVREPGKKPEPFYLSASVPAFRICFERHIPMVIQKAKYASQLETPDGIEFLETLLVCPLLCKGDMRGILLFESMTPDAYTIDEVRFGVAIAEIVAASMDRWQMAMDLKTRNMELLLSNKELERSNKELDQFAYVASHDLMSPLRGIDSISGWLMQDCAAVLPDKSKEHLQKLRQRVIRMESLLKSILEYSRVGRVESEPEALDIRELLDDLTKTLSLPKKFKVKVEGDMPGVLYAPKPAFERIFGNLFSNAAKHNDKLDGEVVVTWDKIPGFHQFSVKDDGPGIDPKFHTAVFEMFRTLRPRDVVEGSGMGLTLVRKSLEHYGGKIRMESTLGDGATFIFTWPDNMKVEDK